MNELDRRTFCRAMLAAGVAAAGSGRLPAATNGRAKRRMTIAFTGGSIGVAANQRESIDLAYRHGFESVGPSAGDLAKLSDAELSELLTDMKEKHLVWAAAGLPVEFRQDEDQFADGMRGLADVAVTLERAGVTRVGTWLRPAHESLTYLQNFRQHARRLRAVAEVLDDHGLRFGLEYVGPKTSWTASRYAFIHSMAETKELLAEIGTSNMGFVLDSWHWYTAGETVDDLLTLKNGDVVACDLNDAPVGIAVNEQMDLIRELPAATGVIDLKDFLGALVEIGYDGPVRAEPFNQKLNALDNEQATAATAAAMNKAFALVGETAPR